METVTKRFNTNHQNYLIGRYTLWVQEVEGTKLTERWHNFTTTCAMLKDIERVPDKNCLQKLRPRTSSHGDSTELMESLVYPGGHKNSIHVQKPVQQTVLSEKNSSLFGIQNMLSNEPCLQQKKVTTPQDATHP